MSDGTAGGTVMVRDIRPGSGSSRPQGLIAVNGMLFFCADDGSHGVELWASDGTASGTVLVKDINPGPATSCLEHWRVPWTRGQVNGTLFFGADDGSHGYELWRSDGTAGGTVMVKDINPGRGSSGPGTPTEVNGRLFFSAGDGTHGGELWTSDGTEGGTHMVRDIHPGSGSSGPQGLVAVKGMLFFNADDGTHGIEMWSSDGTAGGTVLVRDINPGSGDSWPAGKTEVKGRLFFRADDGTHGFELWAMILPPGLTRLMTPWSEMKDRTSSIAWETAAEATRYRAEPDLSTSSAYAQEAGTHYYVDSLAGDDSFPGTELQPWKTLAKVNSMDFQPGDVIHFKRGSTWSEIGGLVIDAADSGLDKDTPVVFTAYGSGTERPIIENPGDWDNNRWSSAIKIYADYVVVEGLKVQNAHEGGVFITADGEHNVVRDIEATQVGTGVIVSGQHNLVTQNYLHDLTMIYNTPGGNDDWGAVGVALYGSNNEISYNEMVSCIADSYDFGTDGGAVEIYGIVNDNYVHHNRGVWNDGFLEVGGSRSEGTCYNNEFAHNLSIDNAGLFSYVHLLGGLVGSDVQNLQVNNNTVYETVPRDYTTIFDFSGSPGPEAFKLRNNVIYADKQVSDETGFTHDHNLYYLPVAGTQLGFPLGEGERIADPLFVDVNAHDFHLQPGSPAIDAGVDLGYPLDFDDQSIPDGAAPDLGAFEYQSPAPANEVIIDDADANFTTSFSQDAWQSNTEVGEHYGGSHHYNTQIGGGDTATWSFTVPEPDSYRVYAWWWADGRRPADVPYTINHQNGATVVYANQQVNGGQWNLLGTFNFGSQDQWSVMVSDLVSAGQDIVADAIRLVPNQPPVANFVYSCTLTACDFDASGSFDPDGPIDSYVWDFGDGNTGSGITASHTYDASGTYSVALTVTDDAGATGDTHETLKWAHIGDLDGQPTMLDGGNWHASVFITVHDADHNPVSDARVAGVWTIGGWAPTAQCTTDASGQCEVSTESLTDYLQKRYEFVKFTVEDVTYAPPYIQGDNHDPDGDSDGTTVTVFKNTPTVNISLPADGASFASGATIDFAGTANDASDGDVTASLVWTSDIDGQIGTGGSFSAVLSDGAHTITATATDSYGAEGSDTVGITVNNGNNPPVASADSATTDEDTSATIMVLDNDTDVDGDTLSVTNLTQPANGTASLNADNTVTYTPNPDFYGSDSFTYTANDGLADSNVATVDVTVNPVNDPPVASFTFTCTGLSCDFDASGSYDPDGTLVSYDWDYGDGSPHGSGVTASHTYAAGGTYSVVLTVTDDDTATDTDVQDVTVSELPTMHVGDLDGNSAAAPRGRWEATVTITIHDGNEGTVSGALVEGNWSGGDSGASSCTTDGSGQCSVTKGNLKRNVASVTFSVSDITSGAGAYDAVANHDPDGDSDGTSITVGKP